MDTKQHIWIVLTGTGTWLSRIIQCFTNAPLNHASISFDHHLREVYSFGRKDVSNPFSGGLVRENLRAPFFYTSHCAIYRLEVSTEKYKLMVHLVQQMMDDQDRYKYDLLGMMGMLFRIRIDRADAYFCSYFVASILEQAGLHPVGKPPQLVTPCDFSHSEDLEEIYQGSLENYLARFPAEPLPYPVPAYMIAEHGEPAKRLQIGTS